MVRAPGWRFWSHQQSMTDLAALSEPLVGHSKAHSSSTNFPLSQKQLGLKLLQWFIYWPYCHISQRGELFTNLFSSKCQCEIGVCCAQTFHRHFLSSYHQTATTLPRTKSLQFSIFNFGKTDVNYLAWSNPLRWIFYTNFQM